MHEKPARPLFLVVKNAGAPFGIRGDACVEQGKRTSPHIDKGVLERAAIVSQRLDLAAKQHDPRLKRLEDLIVVGGFAVRYEVFHVNLRRKIYQKQSQQNNLCRGTFQW